MKKQNLSLVAMAIIGMHSYGVASASTIDIDKSEITDGYYEDSDGFESSNIGSDNDWGWKKNASKIEGKLYESTSDASSSEESSYEEPPFTPATPEYIDYTPFTEMGNAKIKWAPTSGNGNTVKYQVYRSVNNGSWSQIYNGTGTATNLYNLGNGNYQFKVRACVDSRCSSFQTHAFMKVKRKANTSGRISLMESNTANHDLLKNEVSINGTQGATIPKLGHGFDMVTGEALSGHCWNVSNDAEIEGSRTPTISKEMSFSIANTSEELATELEIDRSVDVSAEYAGYSAEYQYTKQLYSKTTSTSDTSVIVARLKDTREQIFAKGEPALSLTAQALDDLRSNKSNFRNNCGDKYIDRVTMGRFSYVTIKVSSSSRTKDEIETTTNSLKLDLKVAEGSYNDTTKQTLSEKYKEYKLDIYATMIGSNANVVQLTDIEALIDYLNDFEQSTNDSLFPVDYSEKFYNIPNEYNTTDHFSVFTDYRPYSNIISNWVKLDNQVGERCYMFNRESTYLSKDQVDNFNRAAGSIDGNRLGFYCANAKRVLLDNIKNCASHQTWATCVSPISQDCRDELQGNGQCMDQMKKLPKWERVEAYDELYVRAPGGCWSDKTYTNTVSTCLAPNAIRDYTKKWVNSDYTTRGVDGAGIDQTAALRVVSVKYEETREGGAECVKGTAKAKCDGRLFGGPGGWYKADQTIFGFTKYNEDYYF